MVLKNVIGRVIFSNRGPAEITSISDCSDRGGRTTSVRTRDGGMFVRILTRAGQHDYYRLVDGSLIKDSRIKEFILEC